MSQRLVAHGTSGTAPQPPPCATHRTQSRSSSHTSRSREQHVLPPCLTRVFVYDATPGLATPFHDTPTLVPSVVHAHASYTYSPLSPRHDSAHERQTVIARAAARAGGPVGRHSTIQLGTNTVLWPVRIFVFVYVTHSGTAEVLSTLDRPALTRWRNYDRVPHATPAASS